MHTDISIASYEPLQIANGSSVDEMIRVIDRLVVKFEQLGSRLTTLTTNLSLLNDLMAVNIGRPQKHDPGYNNGQPRSQVEQSIVVKEGRSTLAQVGDFGKALGSATDAEVKLSEKYQLFEKISEKNLKYVKLANSIKPLGDGLEAVAKIENAQEPVEVVTGYVKLVAAAESMAATMAEFGSLPGMIAGGVVLTFGTLAGTILREKEQLQQSKAIRERRYANNTASLYYPGMDEYKFITTLPAKHIVVPKPVQQYNAAQDLASHSNHTPYVSFFSISDNLRAADAVGYQKRTDHRAMLPPESPENITDKRGRLFSIGREQGLLTYNNALVDFLDGTSDMGKGMSKEAKETTARLANYDLVQTAKKEYNVQANNSNSRPGNNITFNRALIEHFTINVKDSKEGIKDLKRKVEEALLEILNTVTYN